MAEESKQLDKPKNKGGRPKGSTDFLKIRDCVEPEQIADVLDRYMALAMKDNKVTVHFIEQIFGKAKQTIAGDKENPLFEPIAYVKAAGDIAKKYEKDLKEQLMKKK